MSSATDAQRLTLAASLVAAMFGLLVMLLGGLVGNASTGAATPQNSGVAPVQAMRCPSEANG